MNVNQEPLSAEEEAELRSLLQQGGSKSLEFARGVFQAAASSPSRLEPTDWLGLVLGDDSADPVTLRRTFALLMRDYNACVECLALGVPVVPRPEDVVAIEEFCKGYVRTSQKDARWTANLDAFEATLPFAVLAGYLDEQKLLAFVPDDVIDAQAWKEQARLTLGDSVARAFALWSEARRAQPVQAEEKPGRNEPCPCGSGKKFKKCCGAN
jgi:uncharacterized protein